MHLNGSELVVEKLKWNPFFKVPSFLILETRKSIRGSQEMWGFYFHVLIPSCLSFSWRRSLRAHDCLNPQTGPGHLEDSPSPTLVFEMYVLPIVPILDATSGTQPWERNVLLRPSGLYLWLNPVKAFIQTLKILAGRCRDLLVLQPLKTSLIHKFPCLLKLPPTNLEWSASFFGLHA